MMVTMYVLNDYHHAHAVIAYCDGGHKEVVFVALKGKQWWRESDLSTLLTLSACARVTVVILYVVC